MFLSKIPTKGGAIPGSYLLIRDGFPFGVANCKSGTIKARNSERPGPSRDITWPRCKVCSCDRGCSCETRQSRNGVYVSLFFLPMILDSVCRLHQISPWCQMLPLFVSFLFSLSFSLSLFLLALLLASFLKGENWMEVWYNIWCSFISLVVAFKDSYCMIWLFDFTALVKTQSRFAYSTWRCRAYINLSIF